MFLTTYVKTKLFLEEFKNDERGVTAIEYAVIAVAITAIVVTVFGTGTTGLGKIITDLLAKVTTKTASM